MDNTLAFLVNAVTRAVKNVLKQTEMVSLNWNGFPNHLYVSKSSLTLLLKEVHTLTHIMKKFT